MFIRHYVIGIDPGTHRAGWVLYDCKGETVVDVGHDEWATLRQYITEHEQSLIAVCVEGVIIQSYQCPNQSIVTIAEHIGRIQQLCDFMSIKFHQLPRIDICERVSGVRPKRGVKVSKKDMQVAVQKLLNAEKFVRPQHCNDAACAALAFYPPGTYNG